MVSLCCYIVILLYQSGEDFIEKMIHEGIIKGSEVINHEEI